MKTETKPFWYAGAVIDGKPIIIDANEYNNLPEELQDRYQALYTQDQVDAQQPIITSKQTEIFIRAAITETINGIKEWIEEEAIIVDKTDQELIPNAEINVKKTAKKIREYVYPKLEKHGIIFTFTDEETSGS